MASQPPHDRSGFQVALEAEAVCDVMDRVNEYEKRRYGTAPGDPLSYTCGIIGSHNVVLVHLAGMGTINAASAAAYVKVSFVNVKLALVTGICGGVPNPRGKPEIHLGDLIISTAVIQYDFGRQYAGVFARKTGVEDTLGRASEQLRSFTSKLNMRQRRHVLLKDLNGIMKKLERNHPAYSRPDKGSDVRFDASYLHKHRSMDNDGRCECLSGSENAVCKEAQVASCCDLGCELSNNEAPNQDQELSAERSAQGVQVHYGCIGSGNAVVKSGIYRDRVASEGGLIAFEMEGAGAWDRMPTIVVKAVCDYADSHKNKIWQGYAAGVAAAGMKALLDEWMSELLPEIQAADLTPQTHHMVQFQQNERFVDRGNMLEDLEKKLLTGNKHRTLVLAGLGGIGKTQLALEFIYRIRDQYPDYSTFWVPALSMESFKQAYNHMGNELGLKITDSEDVRVAIKKYLSSPKAGKWIMVVDNADDKTLLFGDDADDADRAICSFLPISRLGRILYTTRDQGVAFDLRCNETVQVGKMSSEEAVSLLQDSTVSMTFKPDDPAVQELLEELTHLPLAISQAGAFMRKNEKDPSEYLTLLQAAAEEEVYLLNRAFYDEHRYSTSSNAVATTWLVSFDRIQETSPEAIQLLMAISFLENKAIPQSLLPPMRVRSQMIDAIGTLRAYAFLSVTEAKDQPDPNLSEHLLNMHRLVHLAAKAWRRKQQDEANLRTQIVQHLAGIFPSNDWKFRSIWRSYLPHVLCILNDGRNFVVEEVYDLCLYIGKCLRVDGRTKDAAHWLRICNDWRCSTLNNDDPARLSSQHSLAVTLCANGRTRESLQMLEEVVAIEASILAEDDPSRMASQKELAAVYLADGQTRKAVNMLELVVETMTRVFEKDNPDRLASQHELARAYSADGQTMKAVEMLELVVDLKAKVLGKNHPDQLASQHELAGAYRADGQTTRAVEMLELVVDLKAKVLGKSHPDQLTSQHELARAYQADGQIRKAVEILELVVNMKATVLAEDHTSRLASQHVLAVVYLEDGQIGKAIEMLERVTSLQGSLSEDHPNRLASQHELGRVYLAAGRTQEAVKCLARVVTLQEALVEDHPVRLTSQHALAGVYLANGQIKEAVEMLERVVSLRVSLSEDHPARLASQHELAIAYKADGRVEEAIKQLEHIVSVESRVLRGDHPSRLTSERLLAKIKNDLNGVSQTCSSSSPTLSLSSPGPSMAEFSQILDPLPTQPVTISAAPQQQSPSDLPNARTVSQKPSNSLREPGAPESQESLRASFGERHLRPRKRKRG